MRAKEQKMKQYILGIDQSTQGTKALLFDEGGSAVLRRDAPHRQYIDEKGWVGHDAEEIWQNTLKIVRELFDGTGIEPSAVAGIGISNQRETAVAWERKTGRPIAHAVVWQCARGESVIQRVGTPELEAYVQKSTGLPLSPYFSAAKLAWILENVPEAQMLSEKHELCMGTMDAYLLYRMTEGEAFQTDASNASRTQLFNIRTLSWDEKILNAFGIHEDALPEVCDSDSLFGQTTMGGLFERPVPVHAMLGDSHAALYGQGCFEKGMTKCTYGTGSSVMMNIGRELREAEDGIVTSLAWKIGREAAYVFEGNINYTGAVVTWMKDEAHWIQTDAESEVCAAQANPADRTYLVPAFSGLGAPYYRSDVRAMIFGMSRTTGRNELVRAGLDAIVYQITDIAERMKAQAGIGHMELRADGGPTKNAWLMQRQADILNDPVRVSGLEELSAAGAAFLAGKKLGLYDETVTDRAGFSRYESTMEDTKRKALYQGWQKAVGQLLL